MTHKRESGRLDLLFNISELTDLVAGSPDIQGFLQKAADLVAGHFKAHVCSIYLYNEISKKLVLKATRGLKPGAVNRVSMKPGEGLVGRSFETLSPVREGRASQNPGFKYFKEAGEEAFNSFLCMPIKRGAEKIGVLVVQHRDADYFEPSDEKIIRAVVTQLAGAVENARLLIEIDQPREAEPVSVPPSFIKGRAAAGGTGHGKAVILNENRKSLLYDDSFFEKELTCQDFSRALDRTLQELTDLQKEFARKLPESASLIFTAHFMILKDKNFTGKMKDLIDLGRSPFQAVREIAGKYISIFSASSHAHMKEKAQDVEDLAVRILKNLTTGEGDDDCGKDSIVIARQIYPSDILKLVSGGARGIILTGGGVTSHVTILSRSLKIPLILVEESRLLNLAQGTEILMDGDLGNIYIRPDKETLSLFRSQKRLEKRVREEKLAGKTLTRDGQEVILLSNINLLSEISLAKRLKVGGIGLYRTEFPFLIRSAFPTEGEQYLIYKRLFDEVEDCPVTVRTLDTGGEKSLAYSNSPEEANPELGLRSIRFSLKHPDIFRAQIRAILRAGAGRKNLRIMFPLVSSLDEFRTAKQILNESMADLSREEFDHNTDVEIGMMIELPSVLEILDGFAREADFFSIGTNDFVQYMLGVDRSNKGVADYYLPHHPAVTRGIAKISRAAAFHGIDVSVCGEMAHDPLYIPFLLGVGISALSVDPRFLVRVQEIISNLSMEEARTHAEDLLSKNYVKEAEAVLRTWQNK
ncbi:phosphoenolpyruvate--protein phosphotransferase [Desulfospira joergensenii]|uniref:phosphoenolpyruvate--protein phosphotransferase n=1 Tax=Desulfospira joergensenii TaxID=53329 RepID=UPI0003B69052|nr:phosphoenolpyruvate--protein phosphotransferase [Desulfospira joergensenii]